MGKLRGCLVLVPDIGTLGWVICEEALPPNIGTCPWARWSNFLTVCGMLNGGGKYGAKLTPGRRQYIGYIFFFLYQINYLIIFFSMARPRSNIFCKKSSIIFIIIYFFAFARDLGHGGQFLDRLRDG